MKTWGSGSTVPPFLTWAVDGGQLHTQATLPPGKEHLVSIGQEAGWAPELVSTMCDRKKSPAPAGNKTVTVQTTVHHYTN
jgi:hypothetical protein